MKRYSVHIHCNWGYSRPSVSSYDDLQDALKLFHDTRLGGLGGVVGVIVLDNNNDKKIKAKYLRDQKMR